MNQEALIDTQDDNNDVGSETNGYGNRLRKAREGLGYSVDEVAIELHLARDVIIHIEQEAQTSLPNPIFVRGYLRAYAKLVQVDPEQVIVAFNKICAPEDHKKSIPSRQIVIKPMKAGGEKPVRWVTYIIFIGLIALVLMWWHSHNSDTTGNDNGTMAALATLKPVSDNATTSGVSTTTTTAASNAVTQTALPATAAGSSAVTGSTSQVVSSYSPNNVVDTNVQNLAPNTNAAVSSAATGATPTSSNAANANVQGTVTTSAAAPGQTLTTTPVPVVNAPQTSTGDNSSTGTSTKQPSAKPKSTASAWRNPDLQ